MKREKPKERDRPKGPKVVHITKAKNKFLSFRPSTEPAMEVGAIWPKTVPEYSRAEIADADIRVDMRYGDPFSCVLKKARYVLENANAAFDDPAMRERAAINTVNAIRDYGEIEGVELLKLALGLFGDSEKVRGAISLAVARIGGPEDFTVIVSSIHAGSQSMQPHLDALIEYAERYPASADAIVEALKSLSLVDEPCGRAIEALSKR